MYLKEYFLKSFFIFIALAISACMPTDQQSIKVTIDGIENNQRYNSLPDFSLDYSASANAAQQAGVYSAFQDDLKGVQVLLNGNDISTAMSFSQKYATVDNEQRVFNALQSGKNNLIVQKKSSATSSSVQQLDSATFIYDVSGPGVYISDVSAAGNQYVVSGYAISGAPITSVTLNNQQATVVDQNFTVRVTKNSNYTLAVEDAAGKKSQKRYVADSYVRNALRLRIEDEFLNQPALRRQIISELGGGLSVPTNGINPVVNLNLALASVQANFENPINLGSLDLKNIAFAPSAKNAKFDTGMILRNSKMKLNTKIRAGFVTFNLNTIAKLNSINIDVDGEIKSVNDKLVSNIKKVDVKPSGLSVEIQGLPNFLNAIISPLSNALLPVFQNMVNNIMLDVMNDVFDQLVSDINLSSIAKTETSHVDTRIAKISSDAKNMYIDMQMGIATVRKRKDSIGALTTARAVNFNTANKTTPFKAYTTALTADTQRPRSVANRNVSVAIASDVVNQQLLSSYESGEFVMRAYMVKGQLQVQDNEPARLSNLDLRLRMEFKAPLELMFDGNTKTLNTQVVVPTFRILIDVYQGGSWNNAGTLDTTMSIPGEVKVNNRNARLLVNKSAVELKKLKLDANLLLTLFEPALDKALEDIKPELADMIQDMSVVELQFPGSNGVDNVQVHVNNSQHIGLDMRANFVKVFK